MKKMIPLILILLAVSAFAEEKLDLDSFLLLVKENSKDLSLAEKELEMAAVNKKKAVSTALPTIGLQADYKRNLTEYYMYADFGALGEVLGMGAGGPMKFKVNRWNEYSANVALQQTLFSPSVGSAIKAARQYEKLTENVYDASYQAILTGARKMFYQTLLLKKLVEVSEAAEQNGKENYENTKLKFDNGFVSEFELLQAEVRWKNAIPNTAAAKKNLELALNNMKNWAGLSPATVVDIVGELDDYPAIPADADVQSVLEKRPDFKALLWEEKLRQTNLGAQKATFLPTLTGTAVYAYSAQSDYFRLDQENNLYFAGLTLSMPIFTGGYLRAQIQQAQIELEKSRIKIEQTRESISNTLTNVYLQMFESFKRIESAKATLKVAEKAFQIAENTAQSGLATQLQLKDARVGYDQAQINYYAAILDYRMAYFDWQQTLGMVSP